MTRDADYESGGDRRVETALAHLESYEQDGDELQNWCRVVKARELLREVESDD